jgi:hypothetical protein
MVYLYPLESIHQIIFLDIKQARKNVLSLHHLHAHFLPIQTISTKISMEGITTERVFYGGRDAKQIVNPSPVSIGSYNSFSSQIISRFLLFAEICARDYIPKLYLVEANMRTVIDIVGGVRFTSLSRGVSVNVVE